MTPVVTENHTPPHQDMLTLRLRHKRQATHPWQEARPIPTISELPCRYRNIQATLTVNISNKHTALRIQA
jgi:hypothetical protein